MPGIEEVQVELGAKPHTATVRGKIGVDLSGQKQALVDAVEMVGFDCQYRM